MVRIFFVACLCGLVPAFAQPDSPPALGNADTPVVTAETVGTTILSEDDLRGGVLIVHTLPDLSYTAPAPAGGWCDFCDLRRCEDAHTQVGAGPTVWFVISAWAGEKAFVATEFGLGEFAADLYVFLDHGPCWPSGMAIYYPDVRVFPAPHTAVALATTRSPWRGNYVPVYWFAGYSYQGTGTIPLTKFPLTEHAGWVNTLDIPESYDAACLGALGVGTPGVACCPQPPDSAASAPADGQ
ncbi:MAG: hypothetical protein V1774_09485 [Candidatus Eisenbacteria bacterium]